MMPRFKPPLPLATGLVLLVFQLNEDKIESDSKKDCNREGTKR